MPELGTQFIYLCHIDFDELGPTVFFPWDMALAPFRASAPGFFVYNLAALKPLVVMGLFRGSPWGSFSSLIC